MSRLLEQKRALVTGAGAGIGRAVAGALARGGARVMAADIDPRSARETAGWINDRGGRARWVEVDVSSRVQVEAAFDRVLEAWSGVDLLVNNAGVTHPAGSILDLDPEHLERVMAVDFKGVYWSSRRAGQEMIASHGGSIVNVSSIAGQAPLPLPVYGPMKSAVNMLTRILAREWASQGVRVNAVAPGYVLTPLIKEAIAKGERNPDKIIGRTPMKTMLDPDDVAQAVLFLASPTARHITGTILTVDGGWTSDGGWEAYDHG